MRQLAGNIGGKMASKRQLGGNLGHLKAILRPKRAQEEFGGRVLGGLREAVFSSAGWQLGDSALPFGPDSDTAGWPKGRRRIQPAEREPRRRPNGDILHAL